MLIVLLVIIFSLAIVHSSHVLVVLHMMTEHKLSLSVTLVRPISLCCMGAFCQYSVLSIISGYNLSVVSVFILIIMNSFYFVGLNSAYRGRIKKKTGKVGIK